MGIHLNTMEEVPEEKANETPSGTMGDTKCWDAAKRDDSGLRASIDAKGTNSYYYAHSGASVEPPAPKLIGKELIEVDKVRVINVEKYLFMDDKKKVKVYVEIDGIGEYKDQITCDFTKDTFDLVIKEIDGENTLRRLWVDDLHCAIEPEASKIMVKPNKIIVSLMKDVESTWYKLRKSS